MFAEYVIDSLHNNMQEIHSIQKTSTVFFSWFLGDCLFYIEKVVTSLNVSLSKLRKETKQELAAGKL